MRWLPLTALGFLGIWAVDAASSDRDPAAPRLRDTAATAAPGAAQPDTFRRVGPVPDYAPVGYVVSHARLRQHAPRMAEALDRHLGARHVVETRQPSSADMPDNDLWLRDHQPIYVRNANGTLTAVRPLHPQPSRAQWMPLIPRPSILTKRLPLVHENGNLVTTGRHVFVSERIFDDNARSTVEPELTAGGYLPRSSDATLGVLADALGRPVEDFVILPRMPSEATGHVDLLLMPLDDHTIVVPRIPAQALRAPTTPGEQRLALQTRDFLDQVADTVEALDYRAVRLPMLPPIAVPSVDRPGEVVPAYLSPANGLLLRTARDAVVLMPSIDPAQLEPSERALNEEYVDEWRVGLRKHGWKMEAVDIGDLLPYLGLVRCVTAVVPAP